MKRFCFLMCVLGLVSEQQCFCSDLYESYLPIGAFSRKSLNLSPKEVFIYPISVTHDFPKIDYSKIDLKFKDTYVLRLGSSPTTEHYFPGVNEKPDNSYEAWKNGAYEYNLAKLGLPLKNVVHVSLYEQFKYALDSGYIPSIDYHFKVDDPKTLGSLSHIVANFNHKTLQEASARLLTKIASPVPLFDFIVTDESTTKYIVPDTDVPNSGIYNIIPLLKIGGIALFTHLDEDYKNDFDLDTSPRMSFEDWSSKARPHYDPDGMEAVQFQFTEFNGKIFELHGMQFRINFCTNYDFLQSMQPFNNVPDAVRYIFRLGNPFPSLDQDFSSKLDSYYQSRMLSVRRIS